MAYIEIQIDLSGAKALLDGPKRIKNGIEAGIREATDAVYRDATDPSNYAMAPSGRIERNPGNTLRIITGNLVDSINQEVNELSDGEIEGVIGSALPYARIQEVGGMAGRNLATYIPPRPYLGPALERQEQTIVALIQQAIDAEMSR